MAKLAASVERKTSPSKTDASKMSDTKHPSKTKELIRYVLPSVGSMMFYSLYVVVDGIFVGRGIGETALGAVNLATPALGFLSAIAFMLIMGAATIASISFGRGDKSRANDVFSNCLLVIGVLSIIFSMVALFFAEQLAIVCGAKGELIGETATYMRSYLGFGFFFVLSFLFSTFVRNDGNPALAFWGMASGTILNIFLDWLFIYPLQMGILGAGLASGLGTVLSFSILVFHFILKRGELRFQRPRYNGALMKETLKRGFPEFVTQMCNPVLTYCYNIIVLRIHGEFGLAAFAMIGYLLYVFMAMSSGIAQGVQPLISRRFGQSKHKEERFFFRAGLVTNICVSALLYFITLLAGKTVYTIFSPDPALIDMAYHGTLYIGVGMVLSAVNISFSGYFLATQRTKQALIVAICRAFVFTAPIILLTPVILGNEAVWSGMIGSELCVAILSVFLYIKLRRKDKSKA